MASSTNLQLALLQPAQAQKHVTVNEALQTLDLCVHLSVESRSLTAPVPSPADGARYLVASPATGAWAGAEGRIAAWQDGAWRFLDARAGWLCHVADEGRLIRHDGLGWTGSLGTLTLSALALDSPVEGTASAGAAALPAQPAGFVSVAVDGSVYRIPLYLP